MVELLVLKELMQVLLAAKDVLHHTQEATVLPLSALVRRQAVVQLVRTCHGHVHGQQHKLALVVIGVLDFFVFVLATFNLIIRYIHIVLPVLLLRILRDIDIVAELYDFGVLLLELVARPEIELGELAWCIFEFDS